MMSQNQVIEGITGSIDYLSRKESTIVHPIDQELVRSRVRLLLPANDARTEEQSVFSKGRMVKILKTP